MAAFFPLLTALPLLEKCTEEKQVFLVTSANSPHLFPAALVSEMGF